jgi:DNA-binding PadR family transcriptional regulator
MKRHVILGLLRYDGPRHGYALIKDVHGGSGRAISVGNVYRELGRLMSSGLVRPVAGSSAADPRRRPYEITAAGAAVFDAWLHGPCRDGADGIPDEEHALRAFFAHKVRSPAAGRVLGEWRQELRACRRDLIRAHHDLLSREGDNRDPAVSTLSLWLERQLKHLETDLEFIIRLEASLENERRAEATAAGEAGAPDRHLADGDDAHRNAGP